MGTKVKVEVSALKGLVMAEVMRRGNDLVLNTVDGRRFVMEHEQDCCESVEIESITGDLEDLVGSPILFAEESVSSGSPENFPKMPYGFEDDESSATWTFYKLATVKGWVDIRWFGTSNGYYSEEVDLVEIVEA